MVWVCAPALSQTQEITSLSSGKPTERELKGDQFHSYILALQAGQFLHVVVEQKGIDVVAALFDPSDKKIIEVDSPNGTQGPEPISVIIASTGSYRLEVRSLEKTAAAGKYEAKIVDLRPSVPLDIQRVAAEKAYLDAQLRENEGTKESLSEAIKKYDEAAQLYHVVGDTEGEAKATHSLGSLTYQSGDVAKGLDLYVKALALYRTAGDRNGEGVMLNNIGSYYSDLDEHKKAEEYYLQALPLYRAVGNKLDEVTALNNLGGGYRSLGDNQKALDYHEQAMVLARSIGDKYGEAESLNYLGKVYDDLGENTRALGLYGQALVIRREIDDKKGEAVALSNIGSVLMGQGENQKALEYFLQALPIRRTIGDKRGEGVTLNNIGLAYNNLTETQKALDNYLLSLQVERSVNDRSGEAATLHNIGQVYHRTGENQNALDYYQQALKLDRAISDRRGEGVTLADVGFVYLELGDYQRALNYYLQALQLHREVGDKKDEATTLNSLGIAYRNLGDRKKALESFTQSLPLQRIVGSKHGEASTLNNLGMFYETAPDLPKALEYYTQSLELVRSVGDKAGEGAILDNIAAVYRDMGNRERALDLFEQALPTRRFASDKPGEANTLSHLLYLWSSTSNPRFSVFFGKQAVQRFQTLRGNLAKLDKSVQKTYLKYIESTYRKLASVLITDGRTVEAQQVLDLFKDQQYFDFDSKQEDPRIDLTARESRLAEGLEQQLENVTAAKRLLDEEKRSIGRRQPTPPESEQLTKLNGELTAADAAYRAFLKKAESEFAAPPDESDKVPSTRDLETMQTVLRETSGTTGQKTVAVYTLVGEDAFRTLLVTPDGITSTTYEIKGKDLNDKALQLWKLLRTPKYDPEPVARELYDIVFKPLASKLPRDTKTILWSLDGNLRYVPMATLFDGRDYLIERYQNVVFTRSDREQMTGSVGRVLTGTGLGTSEARTVTLKGAKFQAAALPSVRNELGRIFKQESGKGILSGNVLLDDQFTRSAMLDAMKTHQPVVHIASHFKFQPGDEAGSFLLLGDGSPFTLDEMKARKDLFAGVDLLALSACQTAAQRPDANGREVDGFAELAQRLGARAVMASLWEVSDSSTAELMARFYQNYLKPGSNKAMAMRQAQRALIKGNYRTASAENRQLTQDDADADPSKGDPAKLLLFKKRKDAPFAHPYYWSPFILIGNWK